MNVVDLDESGAAAGGRNAVETATGLEPIG